MDYLRNSRVSSSRSINLEEFFWSPCSAKDFGQFVVRENELRGRFCLEDNDDGISGQIRVH